jgi:tetratricopeptide (TPR) repeat protein
MVLRSNNQDIECWVGLGQAYNALGQFVASLKVLSHAIVLIFATATCNDGSSSGHSSSMQGDLQLGATNGSGMAAGISMPHLQRLWQSRAAADQPLLPFAVDATFQFALVKQQLGLNSEAIAAHKLILQHTKQAYLPSLHAMATALLALAQQQVRQGLYARSAQAMAEAVEYATQSLAQQSNLESLWKVLGDIYAFAHHIPPHELHCALAQSAKGATAADTQQHCYRHSLDAYQRAIGIAQQHGGKSEAYLHFDTGVVSWYLAKIVTTDEAKQYYDTVCL